MHGFLTQNTGCVGSHRSVPPLLRKEGAPIRTFLPPLDSDRLSSQAATTSAPEASRQMNDTTDPYPERPDSRWADAPGNPDDSGAFPGDGMDTAPAPEPGLPWARPVCIPPAAPPSHPILLLESGRLAAFADVALYAVGFLLLAFVGELAVGALVFTCGEEILQAVFLPLTLYRLLVALTVTAVVLRWRRQSVASLGLENRRLLVNLLLGLAALAVVYVLLFSIGFALMTFFPEFAEQMNENASRLLELLPEDLSLFQMIALMTAVGFYEELIFRGFIMTRLRRVTGSWTIAVIVSSAVFAVLHLIDQTASAVVFVGLLSIILSLVTIWTRSIIPAIVAHFLFNLSQVVMLYYFTYDSGTG